jgi:hypothetical protein
MPDTRVRRSAEGEAGAHLGGARGPGAGPTAETLPGRRSLRRQPLRPTATTRWAVPRLPEEAVEAPKGTTAPCSVTIE